MHGDSYNLQRFVNAQKDVYACALAELRDGSKRSHWMWFIFPQMRRLGTSAMAQRYAIGSKAEASGYLAHPVLGARLRESVQAANNVGSKAAAEIFGYPDDLKFRSCLTLFAEASGEQLFQQALDQYFDGAKDPATLRLLAKQNPSS